MSAPQNSDPRHDPAAVSDETLLSTHEKFLGDQPDEKARYKLMPLNLLFIFSGFIFIGATYLGRYSGHFSPQVYNENAPAGGGEAQVAVAVDPIESGRKTYQAVCQACHQANGIGLPPAFPPLAGSEWVVGSEERAIRIVLHGLQGPIKVKGADFNGAMPATGRVAGSGFNLSDDKVAHVLTYIRQEWGNQAAPVAPEKVTEIRTKEGNRPAWTAADLEKLP